MVLFSGTPGPTGVPAPSPMQRGAVGDGYVVNVTDGAEVGNESKRDGVPLEGILMLGSDCTEFGGVCIDMKPEEGTEVVVSSQI
jgi:hypothetical protein